MEISKRDYVYLRGRAVRVERLFEHLLHRVIDSLAKGPQPLAHLARQLSGKTGSSPQLMAEWIRGDRRVEVSERELVYLAGRAPRVKHLSGQGLTDTVFALVSASGPVSTSWLYSTYVGTTPFDGPQIYRLIASDPRLEVSRGTVALAAPPAVTRPQSANPSASRQARQKAVERDPARELMYRIRQELRRPVDELHLTCEMGGARVLFRCDMVADQSIVQLWIGAVSDHQELLAVALDSSTLAPREGWALPLRPADARSRGLVWKRVSVEAAADLIVAKVDALGISPDGVELRAVAHDSAERRERERNIRVLARLRARPRPRSGEVLGDCAKCGHPLTDPASAAIGIGPTCQQRYAPEVIQALRANSALEHPAVKRPKLWVRSLRTWHSALTANAPR